MAPSRRHFIALTVVASAAGSAWAWRSRHDLRASARDWYRRAAFPESPTGDTGEVSSQTIAALCAASADAIGYEVDMAKYERLFRWRARHLPGHLAVYDELAARLDAAARSRGASTFAEATAAVRDAVLEAVLGRARRPRSRISRLLAGTLARHELFLRDHTIGEALLLFARTDALVVLGFESWPGTARGLDDYTKAVAGRPIAQARSL